MTHLQYLNIGLYNQPVRRCLALRIVHIPQKIRCYRPNVRNKSIAMGFVVVTGKHKEPQKYSLIPTYQVNKVCVTDLWVLPLI